MTISIRTADITTLKLDAIVNAANEGLIPGSGVDGAIRRAAGPELTEATAAIGRCPTGEAVITPGYRLPARFVIHTTAPIYAQHTEKEARRLLAACYRNALGLAARHGLASIAFPALGTGIYGNPIAMAAPIAVTAARTHLLNAAPPQHIVFCCFAASDAALYEELLRAG